MTKTKEPDWDIIKLMKPELAFLEGYKLGRKDSEDLYNNLKSKLDDALSELK